MTIRIITISGHKYMNKPNLDFSLQRPIYAKLCKLYLDKIRREQSG